MIYLKEFSVPRNDLAVLEDDWESRRTCYGSRYPFGVFQDRELPRFTMEPITVLCGGNGSGKTTLLNLMGEALELQRSAPFNRSSFYGRYLKLCQAETTAAFTRKVRAVSRIITSDDVFDGLLDLRTLNDGIDENRRALLAEYAEKRHNGMRFHSLEDLDELRRVIDAQRYTGSRYVNETLMRDIPGRSNGESAFLYFTSQIRENGLYLLDEPENSLSAALQLELAKFLEDSARFYGCQFVIATHAPFLLALKGAKVYDLDRSPVEPCSWTEVPNVRAFYEFFHEHQHEFEA